MRGGGERGEEEKEEEEGREELKKGRWRRRRKRRSEMKARPGRKAGGHAEASDYRLIGDISFFFPFFTAHEGVAAVYSTLHACTPTQTHAPTTTHIQTHTHAHTHSCRREGVTIERKSHTFLVDFDLV